MKVLLKEDVDNLGYAGEVMSVADGYGRNYLIPQGLAVKATPGVLKQAHVWRERAAIRMAEVQKEHEALAERIIGTTLMFEARAGDTGKLYGSVTTTDIADQLNEVLGTEIDKRKVVSDPLRQLGEHKVIIRLSRDYNPQVTVLVNPYLDEEEMEAEKLEEVEMTEGFDEEEITEATIENESSEVEIGDEGEELIELSTDAEELVTEELVTEELVTEELVTEELATEELATEEPVEVDATADDEAVQEG